MAKFDKKNATTQVAGKNTGPAKADKPAKEAKEKKERQPKPVFPLTESEDPKVYPFGEPMPTGYSTTKFARLKRDDFKTKAIYCEHRALLCELDAAEWRDTAKGGTKAAQKRFAKLSTKLADLKAQLEAAGIDPDELLADETEAAE